MTKRLIIVIAYVLISLLLTVPANATIIGHDDFFEDDRTNLLWNKDLNVASTSTDINYSTWKKSYDDFYGVTLFDIDGDGIDDDLTWRIATHSELTSLFLSYHQSGESFLFDYEGSVTLVTSEDVPRDDYYMVHVAAFSADELNEYMPSLRYDVYSLLTFPPNMKVSDSLDFQYDYLPRGLNPQPVMVASYEPGAAAVPEPATILLLGAGLVGLAGFSRKSRKS